MDRSEIRDLFLVSREASLRVGLSVQTGSSTGDHYYNMSLSIMLQNEGAVPARAPYVTVPAQSVFKNGEATATVRQTKNGRRGYYLPPDAILHVDDEINVASLQFGFRLLDVINNDVHLAFSQINDFQDAALFSITDGQSPSSRTLPKLPNETVTFGAANAAPQTVNLQANKRDLFLLIQRAILKL